MRDFDKKRLRRSKPLCFALALLLAACDSHPDLSGVWRGFDDLSGEFHRLDIVWPSVVHTTGGGQPVPRVCWWLRGSDVWVACRGQWSVYFTGSSLLVPLDRALRVVEVTR